MTRAPDRPSPSLDTTHAPDVNLLLVSQQLRDKILGRRSGEDKDRRAGRDAPNPVEHRVAVFRVGVERTTDRRYLKIEYHEIQKTVIQHLIRVVPAVGDADVAVAGQNRNGLAQFIDEVLIVLND